MRLACIAATGSSAPDPYLRDVEDFFSLKSKQITI